MNLGTELELGPDYDPAPYILPRGGTLYSRDTSQEWARWRRARDSFVPAPKLSIAQYVALTPRRRMLYDLHCAATHANLPILETPMSAQLTQLIETRIKNNALTWGPATRDGVMVTGGGFQGKTETICEIAATFEDYWWQLTDLLAKPTPGTRDLMIPVAYVQTPVTAKPKSTCEAILDFYGAHIPKYATLPQLLRQVRACIKDNRTVVLILDDITRLRLHRADDQDTFDMIRGLMSMQVTLILVGVDIRESTLLSRARFDARADQWIFPEAANISGSDRGLETQHERRFNLLELDRFHYDTPGINAWVAHLTGIEERLRLLEAPPGMLTAGGMPEYLYQRTNGIVGFLSRLISSACECVMAGRDKAEPEVLTEALLDTIAIDPYEAPGRDPAAGELPHVPERRPQPSGKSRERAAAKRSSAKRRNGSFDDPGLATPHR